MKKSFYNISKDILENEEYNKLKHISHHGINRYDHCYRVAHYTYTITKTLHLNYEEATRAALLHDFFTDEVKEENKFNKLIKHPEYAKENAKKYFELTDMQEDIIVSHMFPLGKNIPKYAESWVVDIADDIAAAYEKCFTIRKELTAATTFLFILFINYIKMI